MVDMVIGKGIHVVLLVVVVAAGPMLMVLLLLLLLLLRCSMMVMVVEPQMAGSSDVCKSFGLLFANDQR